MWLDTFSYESNETTDPTKKSPENNEDGEKVDLDKAMTIEVWWEATNFHNAKETYDFFKKNEISADLDWLVKALNNTMWWEYVTKESLIKTYTDWVESQLIANERNNDIKDFVKSMNTLEYLWEFKTNKDWMIKLILQYSDRFLDEEVIATIGWDDEFKAPSQDKFMTDLRRTWDDSVRFVQEVLYPSNDRTRQKVEEVKRTL